MYAIIMPIGGVFHVWAELDEKQSGISGKCWVPCSEVDNDIITPCYYDD